MEEQIEPCENYRVTRLKLVFSTKQDESLDDFVDKCKLLDIKCDISDTELNEKLIELIVASTQILESQKELLEKSKECTLEEAIQLGRQFEAAAFHASQLNLIMRNFQFLKLPLHAKLTAYKGTTIKCSGIVKIPCSYNIYFLVR